MPWYKETSATNNQQQQQDSGFKTNMENNEAVPMTTVPKHILSKVRQVFVRNPLGLSMDLFRREYIDTDGLVVDVLQMGFDKLEPFLQHLSKNNLVELKYSSNVLMVLPGPAILKHVGPFTQLTTNNEMRLQRRRQDVMGPGDKISPQLLPPDLKVGDFLEVIIAEVFNPYRFWLHLKGETTSAVLESVMDEMDVFYDRPESDSLKIGDDCVVVGLVCANLYKDGDWHRAYIKSMVNLSTVEVFYLDYGTVGQVKKDTLRYLPKRFAQLPGQGIEARLAGIKPEGGLRRFTQATNYRFLQLVKMPPGLVGLVAIVKAFTPKLSLWLVDTSTNDRPEGVAVNQVLVDEGLAELEDMVDQDQDVTVTKPVVNHLLPLRRPVISSKSSTIPTVSSDLPPAYTTNAHVGQMQAEMDTLDISTKSSKENIENPTMKTYPENKEKAGNDSPTTICNELGDDENNNKMIVPLNVPGHKLHKVVVEEKAWMTSNQVSRLIPNWKGRDLLHRMLEMKRLSVESKIVTPCSHPDLCAGLMESKLVQGEIKEVRLYPIKSLPHIINLLLPAPDHELNKALQQEINKL